MIRGCPIMTLLQNTTDKTHAEGKRQCRRQEARDRVKEEDDRQQRGEGVMCQPRSANGCHRKASGGREVPFAMKRNREGSRNRNKGPHRIKLSIGENTPAFLDN